MPIWLGRSALLFNLTLISVLLGRYSVDVADTYNLLYRLKPLGREMHFTVRLRERETEKQYKSKRETERERQEG